MSSLKRLYRDYEKIWCNLVFPLILSFYPLVMIGQGVDVSDSTYSLSNFFYFEKMEGMWVVSTYLANLCGWGLTRLPLGTTLYGMNLYTSLLVTATVLLVYTQLRKWMPAWIVFVGELVAVGFLWIPSTILYNYLTYFLFAAGTILLYKGLVEAKNLWLLLAGVMLGLNVFVRIPNVTEMALILGLWYYLWMEKKSISVIGKKTLICMVGYVTGLVLPLSLVLLQYGVSGLAEAIRGLTAIQAADSSYSPMAMILSVVTAYGRSGKWAVVLGVAAGLGMAMFALRKGQLEKPKRIVFLLGILLLLRFLWGRGMFSFRYYEDYTSMYEWGMIGLYLSWISAAYLLGSARATLEEKLWAVLVMIILMITPLGSNNYTYQNLNNLFLVAPFTLYTFVKVFRYRGGEGPLSGLAFCWKAMVAAAGVMILVQSIGFHLHFRFRDGMDGTPRDYRLASPEAAAGMSTTRENGEALEGLYAFLQEENKLAGSSVILYGDCPGLSFLLKMPFALQTAWPDLDSHPYTAFADDLEGTQTNPIVILRNREPVGEQGKKKKDYLLEWMNGRGYTCKYYNDSYLVYLAEE